jgi:hypothetical protein
MGIGARYSRFHLHLDGREGDLGVRSVWFTTATGEEATGSTRSDRARCRSRKAEPSPWHLIGGDQPRHEQDNSPTNT